MGIPIGTSYTSTVAGRAVKSVTCGKCGGAYVYVVARQATGGGTSLFWLDNSGARDRAQDAALKGLQSALAAAVDPVACPTCHWYQPDMVGELRKRRGKWLVVLAIVAASVAAFALFILWLSEGVRFTRTAAPFWKTIGAAVAVAAVAMAARHMRCTLWDPNADTMWKRGRAPKEAGLAMSKADYDRLGAAPNRPSSGPSATLRQ